MNKTKGEEWGINLMLSESKSTMLYRSLIIAYSTAVTTVRGPNILKITCACHVNNMCISCEQHVHGHVTANYAFNHHSNTHFSQHVRSTSLRHKKLAATRTSLAISWVISSSVKYFY